MQYTDDLCIVCSLLNKHFLYRIVNNNIECTIDAVEKCSGEATVNNRKGKLIFFYEWELSLNWGGCFLNSNNVFHKGKISIPNLSEENDLNDIEITITIDESNDESEILKKFMYDIGRDQIRKVLGEYIKELKEEYSKNLILPKKNEDTFLKTDCNSKPNVIQAFTESSPNKTSTFLLGCKLDVRELSIEEEFKCSANDLYNVLTKASLISSFTRGPARADANRGGE